ncbi:MAG: hypothetical protein ABEJ97_03960 [Halobellus sp.]
MSGTELWIETFARRTGFERLSESLVQHPRLSPYLFVVAVLVVDVPILSTITYLRGYLHPLLAFPLRWAFTPLGLLVAVWIARRLRDEYVRAIEDAGRYVGEDSRTVSFSSRVRYALVITGFLVYFAWLSTSPWAFIAREGPIVGSLKWFVLIPVVYVTLVVDACSLFVHNTLYLPRRLNRLGIELDFSDVLGLGGMYPAGKAMKRGAQLYFGGLAVWSVWQLYWYFFTPEQDSFSSVADIVVFALLWLVGICVLAGGVVFVHRFMRLRKEQAVAEIKSNIERLGEDDDSYFYTNPTSQDDKIEYIQQVHHLREVRETRTFPFRISIAWEMFGVVVFPVAIQAAGIVASQFL